MPFEVGDFVDIIPTQEMDDRGPFLSATEVVGNIGVSTAPGVDPAYVVVEVTLMGTAATPILLSRRKQASGPGSGRLHHGSDAHGRCLGH